MRIEDEAPKGAPEWIVTFADLMSLLLTFFVLLLSFSSIEIEKFKTLSGSIRSAFGLRSELDISDTPMGVQVLPKPAPSYDDTPNDTPNHMLMVRLRRVLEDSELEDRGTVEVKEDGVALRLSGDAVFETGKAELKPAAYALLDELVTVASTSAGRIEVEGHTDDVPIATALYPSNWELSGARAGTAVRYLVSRGVPPLRIRAIGFADTRPLVPNDSAANRAKNRRVEFLFLPEEKEGEHA
jgi:chemotaxis protein MotB